MCGLISLYLLLGLELWQVGQLLGSECVLLSIELDVGGIGDSVDDMLGSSNTHFLDLVALEEVLQFDKVFSR